MVMRSAGSDIGQGVHLRSDAIVVQKVSAQVCAEIREKSSKEG